MKAVYLAALLLTTAFFVLIPSPNALGQADDGDFWLDEEDVSLGHPSPEFIERALNSIEKADPNKATELRRLSTEDPNKFKSEFRRVARQHYGRRRRADRDPNSRPSRQKPEKRDISARMRQVYEEYLKWLNEAYPDEAQKLAEIENAKPELYGRMLGISFRRHYRVYEAAKENPRLADILKEDARLKRQREDLRKRIAAAKNPDKKAQLRAELESVVSRRFDLIIARKLIAYERLSAELAKLQKEVEQKGAEVQKWKDERFKKQNIESRLKDLLSEDKKFKWE